MVAGLTVSCAGEHNGEDVAGCDPTIAEREPQIGSMEVRAQSSVERSEAWALFFPTWEVEPGSPVVLPVDEEIKIVWRVTDGGDDSDFSVIDATGAVTPLLWGPNRQGGNWVRPGDERGTGWFLPSAGCWTLEVRRAIDVHTIVALAE